MPVKSVRVRTAHEIPDRAPLRLQPGERVHLGRRDPTWPQFAFVTAEHGTGWVPARHFSRPEGAAQVVTAYDTTELPTAAGDLLDVLAEDVESGWYWCRDATGREGWVPISTLDA